MLPVYTFLSSPPKRRGKIALSEEFFFGLKKLGFFIAGIKPLTLKNRPEAKRLSVSLNAEFRQWRVLLSLAN